MKKFLDVALLIMFFIGLSSTFFTEKIHEIVGFIFVGTVIAHNFFNRHFYKNIFRGSYPTNRLINIFCIIFFAASILVLTVSGLFMAKFLSCDNLNWRSIHLGAAIFSVIFLFTHLLIHVKKYARGKIFYASSAVAFVMAVGGIFGLPYLDRWFHKVEVNRAEIVHGEKVHISDKILTVYFSRVGNTNFSADVDAVSGASVMKDGEKIIGNAEMISEMIHDAVGGDIFFIQTEKIYPASYSETTKVGKTEFDNNELPKIKNLPPNLDDCDTIILVYPLWWGTLPKAVESFLRNYDLRGKFLIPVVTHGGGGIGDSVNVIKTSTNATVADKVLDIYSSDIPAMRNDIAEYLKNFVRN